MKFASTLFLAALFASAIPAPDTGPLTAGSYLPSIVLIEAVPTQVGLLDIGATSEGWHYVHASGTSGNWFAVPSDWLDRVGGQIDATVGVTFCIKYLQHHGPWGVMTQEVSKKISASGGGSGMSLGQAVSACVSSMQAQLPPAGSYHVVPCKDTTP